MKAFDLVVERKEHYEVHLDEEVLNEEWMENFRKDFYDFETLQEHAEHIAQFRARFGSRMIEGYGVPLENGEKPWYAEEKQVNRAINIEIISEDEEIDVY